MRATMSALVRLARREPAGPDTDLLARFAGIGDQAAFAALVERHGPMVLDVCRRVLRDEHLAADAFQATFLVLSSKAGTVRGGTLASWLFGVARRVALAARRRERTQAHLRTQAKPASVGHDWDDLLAALDEELSRLPDKYRAPLLACYLHGRTQDEAARELGWSLSTVRRRLERGREVLRLRLTARGAFSAGLFAAALVPSARSAMPDELVHAAVLTAAAARAGVPVPGLAAELAKEILPMPMAAKWCLVALGSLLAAGALIGVGIAGRPAEPPKDKPSPAPPAVPEVRRDRFNDPLPPHALARMGTVGFRHRGYVPDLRYTPDGKMLVSGGNASVSIWDVETRNERLVFGRGDSTADHEGCFCPEVIVGGTQVAAFATVTGQERQLRVWDLASGREGRSVRLRPRNEATNDGDKRGSCTYHIAPDGSAVAADWNDGDLWLWNKDGKPTHPLAGVTPKRTPDGPLDTRTSAFSPDSKTIITADSSNLIQVWNVATGERVRSMGGGLPSPQVMAVSPDGKMVATVGMLRSAEKQVPEKLRIWELATSKLLCEIDWKVNDVVFQWPRLTFGHDSKSVILVDSRLNDRSDDSAEVRRWRVADGALLSRWRLPARRANISSVAVHPGGRSLVIGADSGLIREFDLDNGNELTPTDRHLGPVESLAFSPDGIELWTAGQDGAMRTWDAATGEPRAVWRFTEYSQRVLPGGLALGYRANPEKGQKAVVVRDIRTGEARCELTGRGLKESAGGRTAWAGEAMSGNWIEYDLATGRALRSVRTRPGAIAGLSADGSLLVLREDGGKRISGWDVADGKTRFHWLAADHGLFRRRTEYSPGAMDEASVSPDGRRLAALIDRTELWVCKLETGELVRRARVEANTGRLLTFRPDGKVLAVVDGRTIRLLNAGTGEDLAEFVGHLNVTALAFSRDGKRLASGSTDGTAIVWDVSHIAP